MREDNVFDRDYYEDGLCTGVSCYDNYRWIPSLTFPLAHHIVVNLGINKDEVIVDYGCAKGYLVNAMRKLGYQCYGLDISEYAISKVPSEVKSKCFLLSDEISFKDIDEDIDWLISKDVLEHMSEEDIDLLLEEANKRNVKKMFHVVPLGDNGKFRIPEYHMDKTHIQIQDEFWWERKFVEYGWNVKISFSMDGIKEKWTKHLGGGDGFFVLTRG